MQTLISKSEIAGFTKAKNSVSLKGNVDSDESLQDLIKAISENPNLTFLFLENISQKIAIAIPTILKKNDKINMLIISKMSSPYPFKDLIVNLDSVNTLEGILLCAPLTEEQATIFSQNIQKLNSITSLGLTEGNVEMVLKTGPWFPHIKSLSIDNLNDKSTEIILKTINKFSSLEKLMALTKIDEKCVKNLIEKLPNLLIVGGNPQLTEIITKIKQEVIKSAKEQKTAPEKQSSSPKRIFELNQDPHKDKKAKTITEKPPTETPELPNQYKSLQPIILENQSLVDSNKYLTERLKVDETQLKLLVELRPNKRPHESEKEDSNKKPKIETNDSQEIEKLLQPVLPSQDKKDDFKPMLDKITSQNIESILNFKFPKFSNSNVLCMVASYKPEMFIELYQKCMSVFPPIHNFLFQSFEPNAFNIFHAICKKFNEKNLKAFIELIPEDIFKNLIWSLSKQVNTSRIAPIHIIALFHSNELIVEVLKKLGAADLAKHPQEAALLYNCLQNNFNIQPYLKNYICEQFGLKQTQTSAPNSKLELPIDPFLDITKSSELSLESVLNENEKLIKENQELRDNIKLTSDKIKREIQDLPIFYHTFLASPQNAPQSIAVTVEAVTQDPRAALIYKNFK